MILKILVNKLNVLLNIASKYGNIKALYKQGVK